jgi:hypothetical protein
MWRFERTGEGNQAPAIRCPDEFVRRCRWRRKEGVGVAHHTRDPRAENLGLGRSGRVTVARDPIEPPFERPNDAIGRYGREPSFPRMKYRFEHGDYCLLRGGGSGVRSLALLSELRRTRRSLGEGGQPRRLCLRGSRRSALLVTTVRLVTITSPCYTYRPMDFFSDARKRDGRKKRVSPVGGVVLER